MVGERRLQDVVHRTEVRLDRRSVRPRSHEPRPRHRPAPNAPGRAPTRPRRARRAGSSATRCAPSRTLRRPATGAAARRRRTPRCRSAGPRGPRAAPTSRACPTAHSTRRSEQPRPTRSSQAALDDVDERASGPPPGRARSPRPGSARRRRAPRRSGAGAQPMLRPRTTSSLPGTARPRPARSWSRSSSVSRSTTPASPGSGVTDLPALRKRGRLVDQLLGVGGLSSGSRGPIILRHRLPVGAVRPRRGNRARRACAGAPLPGSSGRLELGPQRDHLLLELDDA